MKPSRIPVDSFLRYIGTKFIFYLLSPVFLLSLSYNAVFGIVLSLFTVAFSSILTGVGILAGNYPPSQFSWKQLSIFNEDFVENHIVIYVKPWYRVGPYAMGLLLGYCLAIRQQCKSDFFEFRRIQKYAMWATAFVAAVLSMFGIYPSLQVSPVLRVLN
ncbi:unnamed protein product [Toxocara canis]|uniref:Acyl_transf_3 domain-containing protein n=1 Tax=Toxocara canis TaxID=6265 RepID=A0A183VGY2_TOXCA|nr:unnamed protein product [Toxocara canis]